MTIDRITSRVQEILASTVVGRQRQLTALMGRIATAVAGPDPAEDILGAVFDEMAARMPIDRLAIAVAQTGGEHYAEVATRGVDVPGREPEARHLLDGSLVRAAISGAVALRVDGDLAQAVEDQYPALKPEQEAGLRAWLAIPLVHYERPVGALVVASCTLHSYAADHAAFGELVAQAVSEVAGSWLWQVAVGAREEDILADLGQTLLSSSLDDAYAALADQLAKVAPYDLLAVVRVARSAETATTAFAVGAGDSATPVGETYRVEPGALDDLVGAAGRLVTYESAGLLASIAAQWPPLAVEGIRAVVAAPLPSTGGHAGALLLASTAPGSLDQSHLAHVRQAAAMLSACIERDSLMRRTEALSREEDGLAAMGRATVSAASLKGALADAAAILRGLVPADRIEVSSADGASLLYAFGRGPDGEARPLAFIAAGGGGPVIVDDASEPDDRGRFPALSPYVQAGLRSFMSVPLEYAGDAVGSLALASGTPGAFGGRNREIVLRAAAHAASAISARTTAARLGEVEARERALADLSAAVEAAGDAAALMEAAAAPLRRLVPYDRLDALLIGKGETPTAKLYSTGIPLDVDAIAPAVVEALSEADAPLLMDVGPAKAYADAGIHSVLALPIAGDGVLIGGVALGSTTAGAYGAADLEGAMVVANILSGPFYGITSRAENAVARREMETIAEIGRVASSTIDIREVYGKIAELIGTLLLYERMSLWTADLRRESLSLAFTAGIDADPEDDVRLPVSSREVLGALTSSEAATGDRAEDISRKIFGPLSHAAADLPAVLLAPLVTDEGAMGLLSLRTSRPNAYTAHDADLAQMIAAQLAGPVANAQMHAEYKRVEESVREAVQRLERAVSGSGEGLWDWNISDGQVWWSPRLKEMVGVEGPDGAGVLRGLEARVHPGDRDRVFQCLTGHLERRTPFDVTYRIETGSGEVRWLWDRGNAIWSDTGNPVRMSGSIRDVTGSRQGADPGYPSSVDLHLPLRAIEDFRQTILEGSMSESGQDGTAIAARAAPHARRLAALLDDLRTLSRVMDAPLRRSNVDLSALARALARKMRRAEPDRTVTVSVASGLAVEGDPDLLEVALEELIGNAWKFTSGTEAARIEVGSSDESGSTSYYVRDNGAGFDPANAGSLFDLFQRLHPPEQFEGTGVGLAVVRHIVRRHGGSVWAEAAPGEGATVHFAL